MDHVHYVPVLLTDLGCREHLCLLLSETMGMALLDTGCSKTVCGKQWLSVYLDTLSLQDRRSVKRTDSTNQFRFGDGHVFHSMGTSGLQNFKCPTGGIFLRQMSDFF